MLRKTTIGVISGLAIALTTVSPVLAQTATPAGTLPNTGSISQQHAQTIQFSSQSDNQMIKIGQEAKKYLVVNANHTVSINATAAQLGTTEAEFSKYMLMIDAINSQVLAGHVSVNKRKRQIVNTFHSVITGFRLST